MGIYLRFVGTSALVSALRVDWEASDGVIDAAEISLKQGSNLKSMNTYT